MEIEIREIKDSLIEDVGRCNGEFVIEGRLLVQANDDEIHHSIVKVPKTKKRYEVENVDYAAYVEDPKKTIFLAYADRQIAGQIVLRENWNRYAYVEDIAVDVQFRRMGVGTALMAEAERWTRERNLAGLMLETQNNNTGACSFYERCGFVLGGFDHCLYKGLQPGTEEVALYWYLILDRTDVGCAERRLAGLASKDNGVGSGSRHNQSR